MDCFGIDTVLLTVLIIVIGIGGIVLLKIIGTDK